MTATDNETEAIIECYRRLFKASTPSADFDLMLANATTNQFGQKEIPFMEHEITDEKMVQIIEDILTEFKIKNKRKIQMFKTTIYLGCSPKTKK
jgi:hypothetical protein